MLPNMRIFFVIYGSALALRWAAALYFAILALTTAPEDTSLLLQRGREVMGWVQGNLVLDLVLLTIGLVGLVLAFGWGNWRTALHRYYAKDRLERLSAEARRVAEDIANTISQERARRDTSMSDDFNDPQGRGRFLREITSQDQRYLSKHMMESASIIRRLRDVGYWNPKEFTHEIGIAGATAFAAEAICKELYTASDRINSDLKDATATQQIQLRNLRELRARYLAAAIMQEFDRDKDTFTFWEIQQVLTEAFHRNGVCVETDQTRREDGKEPRDDKGWTPSERVRAHQAQMEALMAVPRILFTSDDLTPPKK